MQTLWPTLARRLAPRVALRRERFELADGDFVDLDWCAGVTSRVQVLILHGLQGSSRSPYARGLLAALAARGWGAAVMHFRGCSGEPNRLDRTYHAGDTGDLDAVVRALRRRGRDQRMAVVGFSLGGNVVLKWLAEQRAQAPVDAAVAVSVPFELDAVAARLERGFARVYRDHLLARLRRDLGRKYARRECPFDLDLACRERSFRGFDQRVTAPLHGFESAEDYYRRASCRTSLAAIEVPTLIVHARDDPFMNSGVIPAVSELSPTTRLEVSRGGGHVGFVGGRHPLRARYWLEERIPDFLAPWITR